MSLHGKNQLEKGFFDFILTLGFVHALKNLHFSRLLITIVCTFSHPIAKAQVVEVEIMWDESANSFKVDGTNESNFSVYEGNVYRIINESGSGAPFSILLNGDEYSHINPFNRIASGIQNYLYWEPLAFDARNVEIVNLNEEDSNLSVSVDSYNYSQTILSPAEAGPGSNFGYSLHLLNENNLFVGAPAYNDEKGRAFLYQFSEDSNKYNLTQVLNPSDEEGMQFGGSIDASGDWIAVASPWTNSSKGRLELFHKDGSSYLLKNVINGLEIGDFLGIQVSMLNDEFAVSSIGKVDIYNYFPNPSRWTKNESLSIVSDNKEGGFGSSLDFNNDTLVVGAPYASAGGVAYIYKKGAAGWQVNTLSPASTAGENAQFGFSTAVDEEATLAAVAAPFDDTIGSQSGAVYTYQLVDNIWEEIEVIFPPDLGSEKRFGYSIDLQSDLLSIVSLGSGSKGKAFLFRFSSSRKKWSLISSLDFADYGITDSSNCHIQLDGQTVSVGFPDDRDGNGTLLSFHGPGWRVETARDLPPLVAGSTLFEFNISEDTTNYFVYDFNGTHPHDAPISWSIESENAFGQSTFELNSTSGVFKYIPDANFSGVHSFYIKLESSEQSSSFPITLNIQNIEDAPVFKEADNILPDASVNVSYEYSLLWEDADNEIPSFSIVSEDVRPLPDGLNLSDGRIIGVPEQEGEHIITVRMEDDESLFVDKNFTLRVISSNAKPIVLWNEIETSRILIRLTEDFSSNDWTNSLDELEVSDPDVGDIISYSVNQFPQHGTLVVNNLVDKPISYVSNPNYSGTDRFTVLLSDGRDTTELEFIVTVDPVNDAPILIANEVNGNVLPRPLELNVSESFRHVFAVSDPDIGDRVKLSFSDLPQWLNFDGNFTLEGTPWTKDFQEDPTPGIYVYISDLDGASSTQYFELQLKPKDYPPEIDQEGPVSFTMLEDTEVSFVYQLSSTDQDSEVTDMNWSVTDHPSHGTIHLIGGESNFSTTVTYMPFADFTGKDTFEVTVYNKSFADASDSISFVIDVNSSNDAPQIISSPFTNLLIGVPWEYELHVYDPDKNEEFSLEVLGLPQWLKINEVSKGAWLFQGIPNSTDSSPVEINIKVTDSFGLFTEQTLELFLFDSAEQVEISPTNIEVAHIKEDHNWSIGQFSVYGANNRKISWSFLNEADFGSVKFDEFSNGTIENLTYIPDPNFYGVDRFTLQATDGFSSDELDFEVNVEQVDDIPDLSLPKNLIIEDGELYEQNISYSDGDGLDTLGDLNIIITPENNWLNIGYLPDEGKVRLQGRAPSETNSTYTFNVVLHDLNDEIVLEGNFTLQVNFFNSAPEILSSSLQIGPIFEDTDYTHNGSLNELAYDKESGDALFWSVSVQPQFGFASISPDGSNLSYVPIENFNGLDSFTLRVLDGGTAQGKPKGQDLEVSILVEAVEDEPFFKTSKSIQVSDGVDFEFEIEASDPDLPTGVFPELRVVSQLPYWINFHDLGNGTGLLTGQPMYYHEGNYSFEVQCSDQDGDAVKRIFNLEVKVEDYPPEIRSNIDGNIVEEIRLFFREDQVSTNIDPTFHAINPDYDADEDLENLQWNVEKYPSSGSGLDVAGYGASPTTFSYALTKDFSGTDEFSISVSEGDRKSLIKFEIIVLPLEDSPVWQKGTQSPPRLIELTPGVLFEYEITSADPDGDILKYELTNYGSIGNDWLQVKHVQERTFLRGIVPSSISTKTSYSYLLKISDPSQRSIFAEFEIVVSPPNNPPEILFGLESVSVLFDFDGSSVNSEFFPLTVEDVNGDPLLWSIGSPPNYGSVKVVQRDGKILKLRYTPSQGYVEHDVFTLRVSDGDLFDEIEVIAFIDRPETSVNLPQRLPPVFSGEYFSHDFTIFSNFGYESLKAQLINPPSWVNPLVISEQPDAKIKNISLSGIVPHNFKGEETLSIEVSNTQMQYLELHPTTVPIEIRNSNMTNVQLSVQHEDQSLVVDKRSIEQKIQELKKYIPLTFQGKIAKVLVSENKFFVLGNFKGEIFFSGKRIGHSDRPSSFLLSVDSAFNLIDKKFFDSSVVCTIVDAVVTSDNEVLVLGNYNSDVSFSGLQIRAKGQSDLFLALLDGKGSKVDVKNLLSFGGPFDEIASGLTIDSDQIFISGSFINGITLGRFNKKSVGLSDGFIARTSLGRLGEFSWMNTYGSTGRDTIRDLIMMNGSLYFVANFEKSLRVGANFFRGEGNKSSFCAKLNPTNGNVLNAYKLQGDGNILAKGILEISDKDKLIIIGEFDGQIFSKTSKAESLMLSDLFLVRFSEDLKPEFIETVQGEGNERWTNWITSVNGDVYLSGTFNKSISLAQSTISSKGSNDSFLLKIDDSSLRIIDHALLQSTQNDEVQTFAFSNKMGLLVGGKSAGSSVYSHSSSSYTISDGNLYLLHMENSPRFISDLPLSLPLDSSFYFPFETIGWKENHLKYNLQIHKMPEWMHVEFNELNGSGYFTGITPVASESVQLDVKVLSYSNNEETEYLHEIDLRNSFTPLFVNALDKVEVSQGEEFAYELNIYDHDANQIWFYHDSPQWFEYQSYQSGKLTFRGLADNASVGTHQINFRLKDDHDLENTFSLFLKVNAVLPGKFLEDEFAYDTWIESWLGKIFLKDSGWAYHVNLGWILLKPSQDGDFLWLWNENWGWVWTTKVIWNKESQSGHLFSEALGSWLYFKQLIGERPIIFMQNEKDWVDY